MIQIQFVLGDRLYRFNLFTNQIPKALFTTGRRDHASYSIHVKNNIYHDKNDALEWCQRLFCIPYRILNVDYAL